MSGFDYAGWVRRAVAFVSSLPERMPSSEVDVSLHIIAPPQIDKSLPDDYPQTLGSASYESALYSLPEDLRKLYQSRATEIACFYHVEQQKGRLYGGPSWISPEKIPGLKREYDSFYADVLDESWEEKSAYIVQNFLPFIELKNGDLIAIDSNSGKHSIYYVAHDDVSFELAEDLESFLREWEACCYIGPECWRLQEHAGLKDGSHLSGDTPEAKSLNDILRGNG